MKITGQILKENREKQGISVLEVSSMIKISPKIITSIESGGEIEPLPPKSFLRGFVQSYAKALNLDVKHVMNTFFDEMGSTHPKPYIKALTDKKDTISPDQRVKDNTSPIPVKVMIAGGILLLVIILFFLTGQIKKYEKEAALPTISPNITSITTTTVIPDNKDKEIINPTSPETKSDLAASSKTEKKEGKLKKENVEPSKPVTKSTNKKDTTNTNETLDKKPKVEVKKQAVSTKQELIIEALATVDIFYSIDGKKEILATLSEDKTKIIRGKKSISLTVSNAGSINLIHNGKDVGVPGALGKKLTLTFPK